MPIRPRQVECVQSLPAATPVPGVRFGAAISRTTGLAAMSSALVSGVVRDHDQIRAVVADRPGMAPQNDAPVLDIPVSRP